MTVTIRRREVLAALGGAAAWPLAARAQQPPMPMIGVLNGQAPDTYAHLMAALRKGLIESGYVEGQNLAIEYRWAEGQNDRLPELAADLVHRGVAVIVTGGSPISSLAAKAATSTIPIVFAFGGDPVKSGLVASLNRPGGNVTGVSQLSNLLEEKRSTSLVIWANARVDAQCGRDRSARQPVQAAARTVGQRLLLLNASSERELDAAFATLVQRRAGALVVTSDAFFNSQRDYIVALATRHGVPASYSQREYAAAGGLMSYGTSLTDAYRLVGVYTAQILKGAKPADLPVLQPTKFELVINLKTATTLGLEVPPNLLALADEVIE